MEVDASAAAWAPRFGRAARLELCAPTGRGAEVQWSRSPTDNFRRANSRGARVLLEWCRTAPTSGARGLHDRNAGRRWIGGWSRPLRRVRPVTSLAFSPSPAGEPSYSRARIPARALLAPPQVGVGACPSSAEELWRLRHPAAAWQPSWSCRRLVRNRRTSASWAATAAVAVRCTSTSSPLPRLGLSPLAAPSPPPPVLQTFPATPSLESRGLRARSHFKPRSSCCALASFTSARDAPASQPSQLTAFASSSARFFPVSRSSPSRPSRRDAPPRAQASGCTPGRRRSRCRRRRSFVQLGHRVLFLFLHVVVVVGAEEVLRVRRAAGCVGCGGTAGAGAGSAIHVLDLHARARRGAWRRPASSCARTPPPRRPPWGSGRCAFGRGRWR